MRCLEGSLYSFYPFTSLSLNCRFVLCPAFMLAYIHEDMKMHKPPEILFIEFIKKSCISKKLKVLHLGTSRTHKNVFSDIHKRCGFSLSFPRRILVDGEDIKYYGHNCMRYFYLNLITIYIVWNNKASYQIRD